MSETYSPNEETLLKGIPASPGIVIGECAIYQEKNWHPPKEVVTDKQIAEEREKFLKAVNTILERLRKEHKQVQDEFGCELAEVLETQIAFLEDEVFLSEILDLITKKRYSAAYATYRIFSEKRKHFDNLEDAYFKDRALDIYQLKKMLLTHISGKKHPDITSVIKGAKIVIADNLSPQDTVRLHRNKVLGFCTNTGGKMSHTAIIARSLGVPAVVGVQNITEKAADGCTVILDGNRGIVIVNPTAATIQHYRRLQDSYLQQRTQLLENAALEAVTTDGHKIEILANMEFEEELETVENVGAEGIGLFRTEGVFLRQNSLPLEDEQAAIYLRIAEKMYPRKVIIRTLDLGGDKISPNLMGKGEDNPFLGWRAIRFWLDHPGGFLRQLKAILRANVKGNVQMMIPMVSGMGELLKVKALLEEARAALRKEGKPFREEIDLGIMVEVPSVAVMADAFAKEVDFFSIGTNDLVQYTLAVDRGNGKVAHLYSHFHPAVLKMIEMTINAGKKHGIDVGMCGEMASDPKAIPLLIAMGFRQLSASPNAIPQIKQMIRSLNLPECQQLWKKVKKQTLTDEIVSCVSKFYREKFPEVNDAGTTELEQSTPA
jgi:phosphotransferase system enzyme I (PtsI)